jgi:hypothetical protein
MKFKHALSIIKLTDIFCAIGKGFLYDIHTMGYAVNLINSRSMQPNLSAYIFVHDNIYYVICKYCNESLLTFVTQMPCHFWLTYNV